MTEQELLKRIERVEIKQILALDSKVSIDRARELHTEMTILVTRLNEMPLVGGPKPTNLRPLVWLLIILLAIVLILSSCTASKHSAKYNAYDHHNGRMVVLKQAVYNHNPYNRGEIVKSDGKIITHDGKRSYTIMGLIGATY